MRLPWLSEVVLQNRWQLRTWSVAGSPVMPWSLQPRTTHRSIKPMPLPLSSFEQHIDEKILQRGLKYYQQGAVEEPEELETGLYQALVEGSEIYTVRVRVKGDAVTEHHCDCPYDLGDVCKHVVALLFHLQRDVLDLPVKVKIGKQAAKPGGGTKKKKPTVAEQVDQALASVPHEDLMAYIRERCLADAHFRQHFLNTCAPETITLEHADYLKQVNGILRGMAGRHGFIDRDDAYGVPSALDSLLAQADELVKKGMSERAMPIATAVLEGSFNSMEFSDDSDGAISGCTDAALAVLRAISGTKPPEPLRARLMDYSMRQYRSGRMRDYDWHEALLCIAAELVGDEQEAEPVFAALNGAAMAHYGGSDARKALMDLTRRFHGEAATAKLEDDFLVHAEVREAAIENAIRTKDWPRARTLAEDGRKVMHDGRPATHEHYWTPHLLRIAQLTKDHNETERLARLLLIESHQSGMEHYELLRSVVPTAQWPAYIDQLIADLRKGRAAFNNHFLAGICAAEGRWDDVLAEARKDTLYNSILDTHEKELAKRFPAEVAAILKMRADALASKQGAKRDDYAQAVRLLRRIRKTGEHAVADALAADWRTRLAKRKGLLEELERGTLKAV